MKRVARLNKQTGQWEYWLIAYTPSGSPVVVGKEKV